MLPKLGNLCMVVDDLGDWYEHSFVALSSCLLSAIASIVCSFDDGAAEGMKNFALAATAGFTDGTEGDRNKFAEVPPPWLKVSTYLYYP